VECLLRASIKHRYSNRRTGTRGEIPYASGMAYNITLPTKNSVGVYYRVASPVLGESHNGI